MNNYRTCTTKDLYIQRAQAERKEHLARLRLVEAIDVQDAISEELERRGEPN